MFPPIHRRLFEMCASMKIPSILLLGVIYVIYVMSGGAVFWKLEGHVVQESIVGLQEEKTRLLQKLPCLDQKSIDSLAEVIQKAIKSGVSLKANTSTKGFWKFTSSAVFAATVVTTIGYGNMSPSTMAGQIFCVFFALFGIPLNVAVLNRIGKYMLVLERKVCDLIARRTSRVQCTRVAVHLLFCVNGVLVFFVLPTLVFRMQEGWSYSQALYYCFITLSTIGFGDYVPDSNPDLNYPDWYGCLLAVWIFFGLAWLALLINHGIDLLERLQAHMKQGKSKDHDDSSLSGQSKEGSEACPEGHSNKVAEATNTAIPEKNLAE